MSFETRGGKEKAFQNIHCKDGAWFMRLDADSTGVEIPQHMAKIMTIALWAEKRAHIPTNKKTASKSEEINCHHFVLHAAQLDGAKELTKESGCQFYLIKRLFFRQFNNYEGFHMYAQRMLAGGVGVGQIQDDLGIVHSFISGLDEMQRPICFQKTGFAGGFEIATLEKIYEENKKQEAYKNQFSWGLASIQDVQSLWKVLPHTL